eukprot:6487582-Amphidinium_carterae.1
MHWKLDYKLTEHLAGDGGAARLQSLFLSSCMPDATTTRSLEDCNLEASKLQKSNLYKFASADAQGEIKAATALLNDLCLQRLPPKSEHLLDFMKSVWAQLPLFVEFKEEAADDDEQEETSDVKEKNGAHVEPVVYRGACCLDLHI